MGGCQPLLSRIRIRKEKQKTVNHPFDRLLSYSTVECADSSLPLVDLLDGVENSIVLRVFVSGLELSLSLEACYYEIEGIC